MRGAGQQLDHEPGQDHAEGPGRKRRVLGVAARKGDVAQPGRAGQGRCGVQHRAGQVDGVHTAGFPGAAGGGDGDRAFPAAHVQHVRTGMDPGQVHETDTHVFKELGAALVVAADGLAETSDDLLLGGPRQRPRCSHWEVISWASLATFTDLLRAYSVCIRSPNPAQSHRADTQGEAAGRHDRGGLPADRRIGGQS